MERRGTGGPLGVGIWAGVLGGHQGEADGVGEHEGHVCPGLVRLTQIKRVTGKG